MVSLQTLLGRRLVLGGRAALETQGYAHYLSQDRSEIHLHGLERPPGWLFALPLPEAFLYRNSRPLFGEDLAGVEFPPLVPDPVELRESGAFQEAGLRVIPWGQWGWPMTVSAPERAILELLDELPDHPPDHRAPRSGRGRLMGFAEAYPRQVALLIRASPAVEEKARQRHDPRGREIKGRMKKMTGTLKGKEHFLSGKKGVCAICVIGDAYAWSDGEEVDCGYGSCHDTYHFVWLDESPEQRPQGYVCASCIDRLAREGRIEAWCSDWHGNLSGVSEKAAALGERLEQKWRTAAQMKRASQGDRLTEQAKRKRTPKTPKPEG